MDDSGRIPKGNTVTITEYIKGQYLELNESMWSISGIYLFAQFLMAEHNEEYKEIMEDIDFDDLLDSLGTTDLGRQIDYACGKKINAFKTEIRRLVDELQGEIEDKEEMRQEFDATEARSINNG